MSARRPVRGPARAVASAVAYAVTATCAACASVVTPPPLPFLERNYVSRTEQDSTLLFEAQIAPHILFVDGLPGTYDRISTDTARRSAGAGRLVATPMFRVRQLDDSSAAVRTPSFMPRLAAEYLRVYRLGPTTVTRNTLGGATVYSPAAALFGARMALAHHSNGQAGCFREGFEPDDPHANHCHPIPGADTTVVKLNRANGDFSTSYLDFALHGTLMNRDRDAGDATTRSVGTLVGVEWHAPWIPFGRLSDEQRALYGSWRLRGQAEGMFAFGDGCTPSRRRTAIYDVGCALHGRTRLTAEGVLAPRDPGALARRVDPRIRPYRWSVELSHAFDYLLGAGVFVRRNDGQDYYNIGFVHRRLVTMYGVVLDLSGRDRVGPKVVVLQP